MNKKLAFDGCLVSFNAPTLPDAGLKFYSLPAYKLHQPLRKNHNVNYAVVKEEALSSTLARIGSKLTYLRKKRGYSSHEDFAHDFNLPRVQYWRIEKGKANITIKSLCKLLTIHNLSVEEFFYQMYEEYKETKKA